MLNNFSPSLADTLEYEGGYSNHPADPGGATMKGVTQRVYNSYRRNKGLAPRSVKLLTNDELHEIYKQNYWDEVKADLLPPGVDMAVFDYGVNSGPSRAIKALQKSINKLGGRSLVVDGRIGPATIDGASSYPPVDLVKAICDERQSFVSRLKTFGVFGKGWTDRISKLRVKATALANVAPMPNKKPDVPPELGLAGDKKDNTLLFQAIGGIAGTSGVGLVTALNNPYALTFALVALCVGAVCTYRFLK